MREMSGIQGIQVNHERHENNTENEEIIKDESADDRVEAQISADSDFCFFVLLR